MKNKAGRLIKSANENTAVMAAIALSKIKGRKNVPVSFPKRHKSIIHYVITKAYWLDCAPR